MFTGTRVPVKNFIDYLEAGDSLEEFLADFPSVTREQAVAALEIATNHFRSDSGVNCQASKLRVGQASACPVGANPPHLPYV